MIRLAMGLVGIVSALLAGGAQAQNAPQYQMVSFGYQGCTVSFGPLQAGYMLDGMIRLATIEGAYGFTFDVTTGTGQLITAPFPANCRPPLGSDPQLFLAAGPILNYAKQSFGFNGCGATFGDLMTDTDEGAMAEAARLANAIGFTYKDTLHYGKLIVGEYPLGCRADPSLSWPLYLAEGSQAQYAKADFGYDGCNVNFGPLMENTTRELMNVAATQAGATAFTFKDTLGYGKLVIGAFPPNCHSDPSMSWPLFLLHKP